MILLSEDPLEPQALLEKISREGAGSLVVHYGIVKPEVEGRKTLGIRLARDGDPEGAMREIEQRLREMRDVVDVLLARRVGELRVGETILVAAVSARTKDAAFKACEEAMELLKEKKGLRKEELFQAG